MTAPTEPAATFERRGAIGIITLNRPRAMNAVNAQLSTEVGEAIELLSADSELSVGIVTGAGRAFCAGMDLKAFAAGESVFAPGHDDWGFAGITRHYIDKPMIAAINGFALGGGTEIALGCDLAVMSEDAVLGLPEVSRGLFAAAGGIVRLPRMVPRRVAMEAILTGDPIDSARALELGLVNRVVPADQVMPAALELAARITRNAPLAVQASKRLAYGALANGDDWSDEVWKLNDDEFTAITATEDALEGARAFAEKRPARWQGR